MSSSVDSLQYYAKAIAALNKLWTPHANQIAVGRAIFLEGIKRINLVMGRRFGKSSLIANIVIRVALSKPYSACVILCPTIKASRKIYWHSGLLKRMLPMEFVEGINNTEGRITFTNGSYIEVTGADDPDSLRGTGIAIYAVDEYKDHKPNVLNVISPALIDGNGILVVGGTPPPVGGDHHFWQLADQSQADPKWRYFQASSYDNPHLDKTLIDEEKRAHEARGEHDVFEREYMARKALGAKTAVYGMFSEERHVKPYEVLRARVLSKLRHWTLVCAMDPGSATVFAVLLVAVNNHTGEVCFLDELYADKVVETSIGAVWPKALEKMKAIYDSDPNDDIQWTYIYDEAAKWMQVELQDQFQVNAFPTQKALNRKAYGVGLIKDLYLYDKLAVSDRCVKFVKETQGYETDENGNYIKKNDHLLDCARYGIHGAHYTMQKSDPTPEPEEPDPVMSKQRWTPEQDARAHFGDSADLGLMEDW
jgi:hypothetical protein